MNFNLGASDLNLVYKACMKILQKVKTVDTQCGSTYKKQNKTSLHGLFFVSGQTKSATFSIKCSSLCVFFAAYFPGFCCF